jgi:flagellar biosynthetic protein FlhB
MIESGEYFFGTAHALRPEVGSAQNVAFTALIHFGRIVAPFMALMIVAGLAFNIFQIGFVFSPQAIQPKLEKLNPFTGFKKFFSVKALVELLKSLTKLGIVAYVVYLTVRGEWDAFLGLTTLTVPALGAQMGLLILKVWFRVVLVMAVIGLLDFAFQRWQHEQELRMTRKESEEENKQFEGDPRVRQRIRQVQRQLAMQRMMQSVPEAEVVVTNPTTYAVALRYGEAQLETAPVVIAKGARLQAERIRSLAVEHDVPIVERPELARTLYRTVELNQPVPEKLFQAVAEVLAFVYQIDRRAKKKQERAQMAERSERLRMQPAAMA